jgi:osmotically-inducible protein OsmY
MRRQLRYVLLLPLLLIGCDEQETAKISKVGSRALHKAETMATEAGEKLGLPNSLAQRVQQRLQWDKQLEGAKIEVKGEQGRVVLTGSLKTEDQRQRAVALAETTVGVKEVLDQMTLAKGE